MHDNDNSNGGGANGLGKADSPEDYRSNKATSISSPSIKSESEANSPSHLSVHSPTISQTGGSNQAANNQIQFKAGNGLRIGTGNELNDIMGAYNNHDDYGNVTGGNDDEAWLYDDDVDAADLPIVLRAMVSISNSPNSSMVAGGGTSSSISAASMRQRFRSRLQAKGINLNSSALSNIPEINRNIGIGELNQRITDLKMEPGVTGSSTVKYNNDTKNPPPCSTNLNDLQSRLYSNTNAMINNYGGMNTNVNSIMQANLRRDSQNSNASTYYCSMQSRRSSQCSQLSSISTMRPSSYNAGSLYDPISPGCSRRSSQMSNVTTGGTSSIGITTSTSNNRNATNCGGNNSCLSGSINSSNNPSLPPPPSSHLISTHLQRLQTSSSLSCIKHPHESGRYSIPNAFAASQIANHITQPNVEANSSIASRRLSEPVQQSSYERLITSPTTLTSTFQNVDLVNTKKSTKPLVGAEPASKETTETSLDHHPNEKVNLDEVEEDELIENKLVLPDEMLQYLNQVADKTSSNNTSGKEAAQNTCQPPMSSPNLYPNSPASPSTITQVMSPQSGHTMSALGSPYSQRNYDQRSQIDTHRRQFPVYYDYYQDRTENTNNQHIKNNNFMCSQQPTVKPMPQELNTNFNQNITAPADSSMTSLPEINSNEVKTNYFGNAPPVPSTAQNHIQTHAKHNEIQCQDITQSQMSPAIVKPSSVTCSNNMDISYSNNQISFNQYTIPTSGTCYNTTNNLNNNSNSNNNTSNMCTDAYQRTLEYVQNCQSWLQTKKNPNQSTNGGFIMPHVPNTNTLQTGQHHQTTDVTSSTHPSPNMVINDMTTSLTSLLEENRYLQMIQ